MIARRWHGRVPAEKLQDYLQLMETIALPDYRSVPGNAGAWCLYRPEDDHFHVEMFTLWENEDSIRRFAGKDLTKAKYYDFDAQYLLEMEPTVTHFEVVEG
jgi:hypothetical protein